MSMGIYGLTTILDEILEFLEKRFTEELIETLKLSAEQVTELTKQIKDSGLIEGLKNFFDAIDRNELAKKLSMTLEDVNNLIKKICDAEIIENLSELLKKVNCYADLLGIE